MRVYVVLREWLLGKEKRSGKTCARAYKTATKKQKQKKDGKESVVCHVRSLSRDSFVVSLAYEILESLRKIVAVLGEL